MPCPDSAVLENIAAGQETPSNLRDHLADCGACHRRLERMRDDNRFLSRFVVDGALPIVPAAPRTDEIEIPGYDIVREIHRGGQGIVYQAVQRSTRRDVAIKVMKQGPFATLADRARFEREIDTLSRLEHPNIVAVHDAGAAGGYQFFVMNYVEGMPLDEFVKESMAPGVKGSARDVRTLLGLFAKICDAVHAAHLRGVIHRDIKPSNIRVDRGGQPHVLDFGLARATDAPRDSAMTRTGQFVGSIPWASPEQVGGDPNQIDLRTDVYSLGAVLFQVLTGALPFDTGSNLRDALDNILRAEPPRPSAAAIAAGGPRLDDELDTIVLKCLSKDRERRYQTAGELAQDLRHYLMDEPIYAKRDSAWYVLRKSARRHRHVIGAAAVGAFVLAVGLGAALYSAVDARRARQRESYERAKALSEAAKSEAVTQVMRVLVPHADLSYGPDNVRPAQQALDRLVARMEGGMLNAQPHVEAAVRTMLGSIYRERGLLAHAEWEYREALRINAMAWGENHLDVAASLDNLAGVLLDRNGLAEAERFCKRGLAVRRALLGGTHRDVAQSLDTLARILLKKEDGPAARRAADEALNIREAALGREHVDVAQSLDTLARICCAAGRNETAAEYARRALSLRLRLLNDEHPAVAASLRTMADAAARMPAACPQSPEALRELAAALGGSGALAGTESLWQRIIALKRGLLGDENPAVAQTLLALGTAQRTRGRLADARDSFQQALRIFRKAGGGQDLTVAEALYHYCLVIEDDCPGLIAASRERAQIYERQLRGKNDMAIIVASRELADRLMYCRDTSGAEAEYTRTIALARELLGPEHRELAWCMSHLAELLLSTARIDQAVALAGESVQMLDRIDQSPSMPRGRMMYTLGCALLARGRLDQAEPQLVQAAEMLDKTYRGRPEHRQALQKVIELYDAAGRTDDAARWRAKAAELPPGDRKP